MNITHIVGNKMIQTVKIIHIKNKVLNIENEMFHKKNAPISLIGFIGIPLSQAYYKL